jgi:hypothetical protein
MWRDFYTTEVFSSVQGGVRKIKGGATAGKSGGVQGPTHPPCRRGSDVADVAVDVVHFGFFAHNSHGD